jgi:hypothetical protein
MVTVSEQQKQQRGEELCAYLESRGLKTRLSDSRWCQKYVLGELGVTVEDVANQLEKMNKLIHTTDYLKIFGQMYYSHLMLCKDNRRLDDVYGERDMISALAARAATNKTNIASVSTCTPDKCLLVDTGAEETVFEAEMKNADMRLLNHNSF